MMTLLVLSGLGIMAQTAEDLEKGKEYWEKYVNTPSVLPLF